MGLVLKESSNRELAPEGQFIAVCVDVVDLGMVETVWEGTKRMTAKCRVVFELGETRADGSRFLVSRRFTASLNEKAALRKFLEDWRGKKFTPEELAGFDTEKLIGQPAVVQIVHNTSGDKTYDDLTVALRPMKGLALIKPSGKYVRVKDRPDTVPPTGNGQPQPPAHSDADAPPRALEDDGSDLPF